MPEYVQMYQVGWRIHDVVCHARINKYDLLILWIRIDVFTLVICLMY